MKLLKQLLLEQPNNKDYDVLSNPKTQLNVLFLGEQLKNNNSFAKQLLNSGKITGNIVSKEFISIETALRLLETNLTKQFNVVVIMIGSKDSKEKSSASAEQKLDMLYKQARRSGAKVVAVSNPTKKFAYGYETRFPSNDAIAAWIESNDSADYIVKANTITSNEIFFEKNGISLNEQGHLVIAKELLDVLQDLGSDINIDDIENTVAGDKKNKLDQNVKNPSQSQSTIVDINKLQTRLQFLNYDIDDKSEITSKKIGPATKKAIQDFQLINGLDVTGELDIATTRVLYSSSAISYSFFTYTSASLFGVKPNPEQKKKDNETLAAREPYVTPSKNVSNFFNSVESLAKNQEAKHGIPASITMAQAALESGWGTSQLATKYKNYFGIKCRSNNCVKLLASDGKMANWQAYSSIEQGFEDHSKVLKANRYSKAFTFPISDYKNWAIAIQDGGYAGVSSTYANTLISLIEKYNLDKYVSSSGTVDGSIEKTADLEAFEKLPFSYKDISSQSTYPRRNQKLPNDDYFIVHHTAGRGTPQSVVGTLNQRKLGIQWVVDREGNIYQTLPRGARGAHILNSDLGPNNSNSQGVEVIAKNDADILPIQAVAVLKLVKALGFSPNQIYGHGQVNPGHKAATEGKTIVDYIKANYG